MWLSGLSTGLWTKRLQVRFPVRAKPEKTPELMLLVTCQTQYVETEIESLWALYSDGRRSEKAVGLHPNRPSYIFFPGQSFYNREWTRCAEGFWNSGRIRWKKLQHSCPGQVAVPTDGGWMGGWSFCLSLEHNGPGASTCPQAVGFSSAAGGQLCLPRARMGLVCRIWNKCFNICITY